MCARKNFGEAVILCGGKSKRMEYDKALLKINGRYIIETIYEKLALCFEKVKLCADTQERLSVFDLEVIEDKIKGRIGPVAGIYSALEQAATQYVFVTAFDMPLLNPQHIEFMKRTLIDHACKPDALVPQNGIYIEPLYSFYSTNAAEVFATELTKGNYKIHNILNKCQTLYLADQHSRMFDENLSMFTNINYSADLEKFT
jgi:molybdopterin-guanine dinucleotide biosynthesis protein A